jgi:hypothetical protein
MVVAVGMLCVRVKMSVLEFVNACSKGGETWPFLSSVMTASCTFEMRFSHVFTDDFTVTFTNQPL